MRKIRKIAVYVTDVWIDKKVIEQQDYESCCYGIEVILLAVIGVVNILVIGFITKTIWQSLAFLLVFIILRRFTGGYHAETVFLCNLYFTIQYLANIAITKLFAFEIPFLWLVIVVIGVSAIVAIGPVEHSNKAISNKKVNKIKALFYYLFFALISILLFEKFYLISLTISVTLLQVIILMAAGIAGQLCNRKEGDNEKKA